MKISLNKLDKTLRSFLTMYLIILTIGVSLGLYFVSHTTQMTPEGAVERFRGSAGNTNDEFEIPESYPKPAGEMLTTTHNHVIGFSFIFFTTGLIFYFNTVIKGFWKKFFLTEPFVSILITFGSLWLMRYVHPSFIYLTIVSSLIMYLSFYVMAGASLVSIWKT